MQFWGERTLFIILSGPVCPGLYGVRTSVVRCAGSWTPRRGQGGFAGEWCGPPSTSLTGWSSLRLAETTKKTQDMVEKVHVYIVHVYNIRGCHCIGLFRAMLHHFTFLWCGIKYCNWHCYYYMYIPTCKLSFVVKGWELSLADIFLSELS